MSNWKTCKFSLLPTLTPFTFSELLWFIYIRLLYAHHLILSCTVQTHKFPSSKFRSVSVPCQSFFMVNNGDLTAVRSFQPQQLAQLYLAHVFHWTYTKRDVFTSLNQHSPPFPFHVDLCVFVFLLGCLKVSSRTFKCSFTLILFPEPQ